MKKIDRENIIFALFILYAGLLVTGYLAGIAVILLTILFFIDKKHRIKNKLKKAFTNPFTILLTIYYLLHFFAYLYSQNKNLALTDIERKIGLLLLPVIITGENISKENIKKVLLFFKNAVILVLSILLIYHFLKYKKGIGEFAHFGYSDLGISFFYYSVFIVFSILILDYFKPKHYFFQIVYLLIFLLLISNRAAILFLFFYFIFWKKSFKYFKNPFFIGISILIITLFVTTDNLFKNKLNILYNSTDFDIEVLQTKNSISTTHNSLEQRIYLWYLAGKLIKQKPLLGYGTGDYKAALYQMYDQYNFKAAKRNKYNTHNQYIQEFLKFGILGGIYFIFMNIYILFISRKKPLLLLSVLLIIWGSIFESYWFRYHGILFIAFTYPLLYKYYENQKNNL